MPINKFMTPVLLELRAKNIKLVKRQRLSPSPTNKERSRICRKYYNSEIRKGKLKYYKDLFAESGSDSKVILGIINQLMNRPQKKVVLIHWMLMVSIFPTSRSLQTKLIHILPVLLKLWQMNCLIQLKILEISFQILNLTM